MRLLLDVIFVSSGWSHANRAEERSKGIGMSRGFTIFLGLVELACGLGVMFGVLTQLAAIGLILVMRGAIGKKFSCGRLDSGVGKRTAAL